MKNKSISIIGFGNVGSAFAHYFLEHNYNLIQVIDSDPEKLKSFHYTGVIKSTDPCSICPDSDYVIIAVRDQVLQEVISNLPKINSIVVHTSGSCPMSFFESSLIQKYGVMYPLQTFSPGDQFLFKDIPFFIEASDSSTLEDVHDFTRSVSDKIYYSDSLSREKVHLSAVFACNFVNHLYFCAEQILSECHFPREILNPLIEQTAVKACKMGAMKSQTGPAYRNDITILSKHIKMLESNSHLQNLYELLSDSILKNK